MSENEIKPVLWDMSCETTVDGAEIPGTTDITPCPHGRFVHIDDYKSAIDRLTAERDALSTLLAVAGGRLEEAANEIEGWGACADEYFQKTHRLAEVVQSFRDDAKDAADAARSEGE